MGRNASGQLSPGWGVLRIMAFTGKLRPKGVPFSGFSYMKGLGFHQLKYIYSINRLKKANRRIYMTVKKSKKFTGFVIFFMF